MNDARIAISFITLLFVLSAEPMPVLAQGLPGLPSNALEAMGGQQGNSLADMLKMDLMKRFMQTKEENQTESQPRAQRPRPELGRRPSKQQPLDLSKYLGPDGDPERAWQILQEKGKVPAEAGAPAPPVANTTSAEETWDDVPLEKRLSYIGDLLERRRFHQAQNEIERILNQDQQLSSKQKLQALILREKALFHNNHYETVQNDYYRLKAYYPDSKQVDKLKAYFEKQTGIAQLQEHVKQNIADPQRHQRLVDQYKRYGWLDFAEQFFADEIRDTSPATIKSLSEIYFAKQDYAMLVKLSRAGQNLFPQAADFAYNEGVGLYHQGDPLSREQALQAFQKTLRLSPSPALRQKLNWYLKRLMK